MAQYGRNEKSREMRLFESDWRHSEVELPNCRCGLARGFANHLTSDNVDAHLIEVNRLLPAIGSRVLLH